MHPMPDWATEMLAKPQMDKVVELMRLSDDHEAAANWYFRDRLVTLYRQARHLDPATVADPLLRMMLHLSREYQPDDSRWWSMWAVLREETAEDFLEWMNERNRWRQPGEEPFVRWLYEGPDGELVDRFQVAEASENMERAVAAAARSKPAATSSGGGCYVATAVYGSYDAPSVLTLRRFRDERLLVTAIGRGLVRIYYSLSPMLIKRWGRRRRLQKAVRMALDAVVRRLEHAGY
ncbi:CFI-box-CTERM domain-containing protein [Agrococcus citreus]|uniref:Uncharacterized protein n=1 Tax=Agrococcus citreus TaxID=84643 RepID=A0ABN1YPZ0_9MICO